MVPFKEQIQCTEWYGSRGPANPRILYYMWNNPFLGVNRHNNCYNTSRGMTAHRPLVPEDMLVHILGPENTPAHFPASIFLLPGHFTAPEIKKINHFGLFSTYLNQFRFNGNARDCIQHASQYTWFRHNFRHWFLSCRVNLQHRKSRKSTILAYILCT